jgi:hypothetical protein
MRTTARSALLLAVLALLSSGAGCLTAEQRMVQTVEGFRERERWDDALFYLDGWLKKHRTNLAGWRYRVLLRLDKDERAGAALEYARLAEALARQEPDVLKEVVLGDGGRWLLSDYRALARCETLASDIGLFEEILAPKELGKGSLTKVAVAQDEVFAVVDALPGRLDPARAWGIVEAQGLGAGKDLRARIVRAAGRHLEAGLTGKGQDEAVGVILEAAGDGDAGMREAALVAWLGLPDVPGAADIGAELAAALARVGDHGRVLSLVLAGPGGRGPAGWADRHLRPWVETGEPVVRVVAMGTLQAIDPKPERLDFLKKAAAAPQAAQKLAAALARGLVPGADWAGPEQLWPTLSPPDRRQWAPSLARHRGPDRRIWVSLVVTDKDALVAQAGLAAMAIPELGDDEEVDPALQKALSAMDASTRAVAARAAVVRGAPSLLLPVSGLFAQDEDRAMVEALQGMVEGGSAAFRPLVAAGLGSSLPLVRELAVDAAAAACGQEDQALLLGLLKDGDPHVAVRAASALYLRIGTRTTGT